MSAIKSKLNPRSDEFQANARAMAALVANLREKVERAAQVAASFNAPLEETRFGVFRM